MGVPGVDGYTLFMLLTVHANCCWSYLSRHTTSRQYLLPDRVYKALRAGKCLVSFKGSMIPIIRAKTIIQYLYYYYQNTARLLPLLLLLLYHNRSLCILYSYYANYLDGLVVIANVLPPALNQAYPRLFVAGPSPPSLSYLVGNNTLGWWWHSLALAVVKPPGQSLDIK